MTADSNASASMHRPGVSLRAEQPGDEPFLFEVYASTREDELALTDWDPATRSAFLQHQFKAMRMGYLSMFPRAEFLVVLNDRTPIGRMVISRSADMIRVVDVALLPAARGKGIGTLLMRRVQAEATAASVPIRLQVFQNNRARHLYHRIGFEIAGHDGPYYQLQWTPPG